MAQTATSLPNTIPFGVLKQCHPDYAADTWEELNDLYEGGYKLAKKAAKYMPQLALESDARYQERLKGTGYIGYLGQIVDYFVSALFANDLTVTEAPDADDPNTPGGKSDTKFYSAFAHDADLAGNSFPQVVHDAFRNAILLKRSLICVDFPTVPEADTIQTRADEDAIGVNRAYVYEMPLAQLINWKLDKWGAYEFAVVYTRDTEQGSVVVQRGSAIKHRFKLWTRDPGAKARWWIYEKVEETVAPFTDDTPIPLADNGDTTFDAIPIVPFEIKSGLWVGNKLGCLAKEHWIRRATLVSAENKSMVAVPFVKRGPEMSAIGQALPSQTQQDPTRGRNPVGRALANGWVEIGAQDEIGFAEPAGNCYVQVGKELAELKDEMHRIVHQMAASVDNSSSTTRRSGDSKKQDRAAESIVLGQFGRDVREIAKKIYDIIANARGEKVVWVPRGLDTFDTTERADLLAESVQVDLVNIQSQTFKKEHKTQLALKLVDNAPPETQDQIRKEISDSVEAEQQLKLLRQKAEKDQILNPLPPVAPTPAFGKGPPPNGGKTPPDDRR